MSLSSKSVRQLIAAGVGLMAMAACGQAPYSSQSSVSTQSAVPSSAPASPTSTPTASPIVLSQTLFGGSGTGVRLQPTDATPTISAASALAAIAGHLDLTGLDSRTPQLFLASYSRNLTTTTASPGSTNYTTPVLVWVVLYAGLPDLDPHNNAPAVSGTPAPVATYPASDCDDVYYVDAGSGNLLRTDSGCPGMFAGETP